MDILFFMLIRLFKDIKKKTVHWMADGLIGEISRQHRIPDSGGEVERNSL